MSPFARRLPAKRRRDTRHRVDDVSGFSEPKAEKTRFCIHAQGASSHFSGLEKEQVKQLCGADSRLELPLISYRIERRRVVETTPGHTVTKRQRSSCHRHERR